MQTVFFISVIVFFSVAILISILGIKTTIRYSKSREKKYYQFIKDNPTIAGTRPFSPFNLKRFLVFCKPFREYSRQDPEFSAIEREYKKWRNIHILWCVFGFLGIIVAMSIAASFSG